MPARLQEKLKLLLRKAGLKPVLVGLYKAFIRPARIRRYLDSHEVRKLQIGSGPNLLPGWLNTDIRLGLKNRGGSYAFLDATKRFPFQDETFDYLFCEHLIEHMGYGKARGMLRECLRVLKPGGKIRISTPDLHFLIELYSPEKTELQKRYIARAVSKSLPEIGIKEDVFVINNFFRAWGHEFIYDYKVLKGTLESAGFVGVERQEVGASRDPNFSALESHGGVIGAEFNRLETLVVEGRKPD
jgi:predicted SAM-dependent methyltransferase